MKSISTITTCPDCGELFPYERKSKPRIYCGECSTARQNEKRRPRPRVIRYAGYDRTERQFSERDFV